MSQIDIFIFFPMLSWFWLFMVVFYSMVLLILLTYIYNSLKVKYWFSYKLYRTNSLNSMKFSKKGKLITNLKFFNNILSLKKKL